MPLLVAEGLDDIEKVFCNSHHSMILCCRKRHIPVGSYVISGNIAYLKPGVVRRQQEYFHTWDLKVGSYVLVFVMTYSMLPCKKYPDFLFFLLAVT